MSILGILGIGGGFSAAAFGVAMVAVPGLAGAVSKLAGAAIDFLAALPWAKIWWIVPLVLAALVVIVQGHKLANRDDTIAGQEVLIGKVKAEVDRGVGTPTPAADAPTYIRSFVDSLATVSAALDRQTKALNAAKADAEAAVSAAHHAAQPTQAQGEREKVRQKIADPGRTTGLTAEEWGKL